MIHTTVGVYKDLSIKSNGVGSERLAKHIQYNISNRWGRALFLDGYCIYKGYLTNEEIEKVQEQIDNIKHNQKTAPHI